MVESISANSSYSAAINSAVANQGSSTSTTSTTSTTSVSNDTITSEQKTELKNLGLNNDPTITTSSDAKIAIEKAQKAAHKKTTELSESNKNNKIDDIKDIVDISKQAQNAFSSEATE